MLNADNGKVAQPGGEIPDSEKFFIQYNNVPIGLEVYKNKVFVTVPRRRHGIPSTLNYVDLDASTSSPSLKPYPDVEASKTLTSVYRPRVDSCHRLWMVDTGLLEVPDERKQLSPPSIVVYDLKTDKLILRHELKNSDLVDERTPAGLTSITVDVMESCWNTFAYVTDLVSGGLVVFSLRDRETWRLSHETFLYDPKALNFNVAGNIIDWKDGVFSLALSEPSSEGYRTAYYHPLASTKEYSISTKALQNSKHNATALSEIKVVGDRGADSQSGSHVYVPNRNVLLYANVARDAIACWKPDDVARKFNILVQDHEKLVYVSDLKIRDGYIWMLSNQIPNFVYSTLNTNETNFYIHKASIDELLFRTVF